MSYDDPQGIRQADAKFNAPAEEHGVWDNIKAGTGRLVSDIGGVASMFGADDIGRSMSAYGDDVYQRNATPRTSDFTFSELLNPTSHTWSADVPQMLPSIASLLIPAAGATGIAGRTMVGAGRTFGALSNAEKMALMGRAGMVGGATSGVLESLQEGGGVTNEQLQAWQRQAQQLHPNDPYAQEMYYQQNKGNAQMAGWQDFALNLPVTVGSSMLAGKIPFGSKLSAPMKILGEMAGEGSQEVYQNWASDFSQNKNFDITSPENMQAGALGALMGGAVGAGGHLIKGKASNITPDKLPAGEVVDHMSNREVSHMWQTQILPMASENPEFAQAFSLEEINSIPKYEDKVERMKQIIKNNENLFDDVSIFPERAYTQALTKYNQNIAYDEDTTTDNYAGTHGEYSGQNNLDVANRDNANVTSPVGLALSNGALPADFQNNVLRPQLQNPPALVENEGVKTSYPPQYPVQTNFIENGNNQLQFNPYSTERAESGRVQGKQVEQPPVKEAEAPGQMSLFTNQNQAEWTEGLTKYDKGGQIPANRSLQNVTQERSAVPVKGTEKQITPTGENFQLAQSNNKASESKVSQAVTSYRQATKNLKKQLESGAINKEAFDKKSAEFKSAFGQYLKHIGYSPEVLNKGQGKVKATQEVPSSASVVKAPVTQAQNTIQTSSNPKMAEDGTPLTYTLANGKSYKSTVGKVKENIVKLDKAIAEIKDGKWSAENPYYEKGLSKKKALENFESAKADLQKEIDKANKTAERDAATWKSDGKGNITNPKGEKFLVANNMQEPPKKKGSGNNKLYSGIDPTEAYNALKPLVGKTKEAIPKLVDLGRHVYNQGSTGAVDWAKAMKGHLKDLFGKFKNVLNDVYKQVKSSFSNGDKKPSKQPPGKPPGNMDINQVTFTNKALKNEGMRKKAEKLKAEGWAEKIVKDGKVYVRPKHNLTPYTTNSKKYDSLLAGKTSNKQETRGLKGKINQAMDDFRTDWIDNLHPLLKLPGGEQLYKMAWANRGWAGKAEVLIGNERFSDKDIAKHDKYLMKEYGHKSFQSIIRNVQDKLEQFGEYSYAMRVDNWKRDVNQEMSKAEAKEIIANAPAHFKTTLDDLVKLNHHLQDILVDGGIISKETKQQWNEVDPYYVPLHKQFDDSAVEELTKSKGFTNVQTPIKKMKGSQGHLTYNPVESMVKNIYSFVNIAERNKVGQEFVRMNASLPDLVKKIEGKYSSDPKESIFTVWDGGHKQAYQTSPELYRAMAMMDSESAGSLFKILQIPASTLRLGATLSPDFVVRNLVRDQLSAFFFSKHGYIPMVDAFKGIMSFMKKDKLYFDYLNSGAAQSHFLTFDREGLQKNVEGLMKKGATETAWGKYNPIALMKWLSEISEIGTRLGEFDNAQKGYNGIVGRMIGDKSNKLSGSDLAIAPRDITIDFGRAGVKGKEINKYVAFFNANVQGWDKLYREFKTNPSSALVKSLLFITIPSMMLWSQNKDDKRYQELPKWQKDLFWIIPSGDTVYRVPKPFELGTFFASSFERAMDAMYKKDPRAFKDFEETVLGQIPNPLKITALIPFVEWATNYSFFTDRPIVPQSEQKLPKHLQSSPYNSELAKFIGKSDLVSPRHVDNFIRNYFGTLGGIVSSDLGNPIMNEVTGNGDRPAKKANDLPVVRAFTVDPMKSPESITAFYDRVNELEIERNGYKREHGGSDKGFDSKKLAELKRLHQTQKKLNDLHQVQQEVTNNKTMSAETKRTQLDKLMEQQLKIVSNRG